MNTSISFSRFRHWPATVGLLAIACLFSATAQAQRPSIAALQSQIAALQANNVPNLASYVSVDTSTPSRPAVKITAANLQVVNGSGGTLNANGLGNVIVGYDEARSTSTIYACSIGQWTDLTSCTNNGGIWALSFKSGSHNVVIGAEHAYSQYGGLVAGYRNVINGVESSVLAGLDNIAAGTRTSIAGGSTNRTSGFHTSVSGGDGNLASGYAASVSGGGNGNTASGDYASVSGGNHNTASGLFSSVSGGAVNVAAGSDSSVSGGSGITENDFFGWQGGTLKSP